MTNFFPPAKIGIILDTDKIKKCVSIGEYTIDTLGLDILVGRLAQTCAGKTIEIIVLDKSK